MSLLEATAEFWRIWSRITTITITRTHQEMQPAGETPLSPAGRSTSMIADCA